MGRLLTVFLLAAFGFGGCRSASKIPAVSGLAGIANSIELSALLKGPDPITTSFADASADHSLPADFGNAMRPQRFSVLPRAQNGGYVLFPGFFETAFRSYCLHAGTHGPSKGDGYLFAKLKGPREDIIESLVIRGADRISES